jgi:hypothetical protein
MMRTALRAMSALTLAAILMLIPATPVLLFGQNDGAVVNEKLEGTWNVTLRFPVCTAACSCPGGVPNIPIPALNTYLKDSTMLVALGGSLFAGPGQGSWERIAHNTFRSRFKFFIFNSSGMRVASEIVTKTIALTGADTFLATATFDLFDNAGNVTAQGCPINETGTRF